MIHDAKIEVTCDNEHCRSSTLYDVPYRYRSTAESSGFYDADDSAIEEFLEDEEWVVEDGKHYCSQSCASAASVPNAKIKAKAKQR